MVLEYLATIRTLPSDQQEERGPGSSLSRRTNLEKQGYSLPGPGVALQSGCVLDGTATRGAGIFKDHCPLRKVKEPFCATSELGYAI